MALLRIVAAVAVAGFLSAVPAAAAPAATRLSISVSDGVSQVRDKTSVAYVATVVNAGTAPVTGRLVLEVPQYARYGRVRAATVVHRTASWTVRVQPGATVRRRAPVRIGTIPSGQLRVTSLASLFLGSVTGSPAIRAADSDRIAGVVDPPATPVRSPVSRARAAPPGRDHRGAGAWLWLGLPSVGLAAAAVAGLLVWRRRRAGAAG